jgi:hypothetical protein
MSTAHEVLHELKMARVRSEEEERKWAERRRQCRSPDVLWPVWGGMFLLVCVLGMLWVRNHPGDWRALPYTPAATLLIMLPAIVFMWRRREKALLEIVATEAPQLFQKLKEEGIVGPAANGSRAFRSG